jgi:hypothetical protein
MAPAATALSTFVEKSHCPLAMTAINPLGKFAKSLEAHPSWGTILGCRNQKN